MGYVHSFGPVFSHPMAWWLGFLGPAMLVMLLLYAFVAVPAAYRQGRPSTRAVQVAAAEPAGDYRWYSDQRAAQETGVLAAGGACGLALLLTGNWWSVAGVPVVIVCLLALRPSRAGYAAWQDRNRAAHPGG